MADRPARLRDDALALFRAAIAAADPARVLHAAWPDSPSSRPRWIIALGKAAPSMAAAALAEADRAGSIVRGGLVVAADEGSTADPRLPRVTGDHPLPANRSERAGRTLGELVARVGPNDEARVFLSGGASSLLGTPVPGLSPASYRALMAQLGRAGLPIDELNRIRKRFSRWGAGRLAAALPDCPIRVFAISDVPGDDLATIGSGPCQPDPTTGPEIRALLDRRGVWARIDPRARAELVTILEGPETPKPGDPRFARVSTRIVASNATALDGAAREAAARGYRVHRPAALLAGEATAQGGSIARELRRLAADEGPIAWIGGGETTVDWSGSSAGRGGRCQELALAGAREFSGSDPTRPIVLLAAGTDGRDGPTDAAGAMVDRATWEEIIAAGVDPGGALRRHDAYPALEAVGALVRTGSTGTNVMDVVIGLVGRATD
jgi:hydroxypyruvate reductase